MKEILRICALLLLMVGICLPFAQAQSYAKLWKQIEEAQKNSLPQTAIDLADKIYRKAEKEKNVAQMLKARICRDAYQESLTPDSFYVHLDQLEQWAQQEQNPVNKSILHSLLAREYADYVRKHRRELNGRTALDMNDAPEDIREWTVSLFVDKTDAHSRASLADATSLVNTASKGYMPFVIQEAGSVFYGHDLYHLLAKRAVDTYKKLDGLAEDTLMDARIDEVYTQMMTVYSQSDKTQDALVLSTLDYLDWKNSNGRTLQASSGDSGQDNADCLRALNELIDRYGACEACAEVYIYKASFLARSDNNRLAEALRVCDEGLKRYPAYKRVDELKNIKENILRTELLVQTDGSAYPGDSLALKVRYRNLDGFTVNLYATDYQEVPLGITKFDADFYQQHARRLASAHYALQPLPKEGVAAEDGKYLASDTVCRLSVPDETGVYVLQVVSDVQGVEAESNFLVSTRFKMLTLSLSDNRQEVVVVDAFSGHPVPEAEVTFYSATLGDKREKVASVTTDSQGKALLAWDKNIRTYVVRKGTDCAMLPQSIYSSTPYRGGETKSQPHVTLLTDRALYRPGQTIYVKGIAYEQGADSAQVLEGKTYSVLLQDTNGKEVDRKEVRTNAFGSFTTELMLPTACLNGNFKVSVKGGTSVRVRVEEYKRPSFEITFQPVQQAYVVGDTVRITGNVKSYSGVSLQGVPLAYTVSRSASYCRIWNRESVSLVSDTVRLSTDGSFSIPVVLKGESGTASGAFAYQLNVSVTNDAGETQTEKYSLNASQTLYTFVSGLTGNVCKDDSIRGKLSVKNAAGETLAMEGVCRLYPLAGSGKDKVGDKPVYEERFVSGELKDFSAWKALPSGAYRLVLSATGRDGKEVNNAESREDIVLFSPKDPRPATFMETFYYEENTTFDATHPAVFYFGTSYKDAYVLVDVFGKKGRLDSRVLMLNDSIMRMEYPYQEAYGDGVSVVFAFVKKGQMYTHRVELAKRFPERTLDMQWSVFRDRLRPGQEEEWRIIIKTPQGFPAAAEMLALMYDASLDEIYSRNQSLAVHFSRYIPAYYWKASGNPSRSYLLDFPQNSWKTSTWAYDYFYAPSIASEALLLSGPVYLKSAQSRSAKALDNQSVDLLEEEAALLQSVESASEAESVRSNFAETAFFYPQLQTNAKGEVAFSFTMPESLTRWNFRGYSHTKDMITGMLKATAVTSKEFMLSPNMPRYVRVGDKTRIAASLANLSNQSVKGTATFTLFDPMTEKVISTQRQKFAVGAGKTIALDFGFEATDRYDLLGVRMVADAGTFSDGEQHVLPVLSDKEYITETLALPVRGEETRVFALDSLFNGGSSTATHRRLTVEFSGNPAWYAVQALPVLSLPDTEDAVSWAAAFYANTLAGLITSAQPRVKTLIDKLSAAGGTRETFLDRLAQNQDVKNILIGESPWLMEATTEADQLARLATLFDVNQMNYRNLSALRKLESLQGADGAWSWCEGMPGNRYITAYITGLLVRLSQLDKSILTDDASQMLEAAFNYLNEDALEEYRRMRKAEKNGAERVILSEAAMDYLYLTTLGGVSLSGDYREAYNYFLSKVSGNLENGTMMCKAKSAVILQQAGRKSEAAAFIASLKEHLVQTDERGAYFAFHEGTYAWGMMPVPTQVAAMEALRLAGGNDALVEEMKIWLLKQKQTTAWTSPVATADAVYALLCGGSDLLASQGDVRLTLGNRVLETVSSRPAESTAVSGLGYLKETFADDSSVLTAKTITVEKRDAGIAWGAVYAQYLSPISDVKQQGGPLNVEKKLFVERVAADGTRSLQPLAEGVSLSVGDKIISRLTLSLDRAMDFVQLKDQRGACFEPDASLSGYRSSGGNCYYMEVEDAATHFFFDYLGKGVHVLEHTYRIARSGTYEAGLATLQCAYAPEYASHSAGGTVTVK